MSAKIGSLAVFWALIEPVLARLRPARFCEIGVESGQFTAQLLTWGRANGCEYVGIDPVIDPAIVAGLRTSDADARARFLAGRSLEVLPELEYCGAYFVDGDHNYHTVRNELACIQRTAAAVGAASPVIFVHDVGWPWGRRDMYYQPGTVPAEAAHPASDRLGVHLAGDELIDGGLRAPGRYHIALRAGGPRNGVLTAVEDFLAGDGGPGWESIIVPAAYGLAILHRPDDDALPRACRDYLRDLRAAIGLTGGFLGACEANYLVLYLYGEDAGHALKAEGGSHLKTLEAYAAMEKVYHAVSAHNESLGTEYRRLQGEYTALLTEYQRLLDHYNEIRKGCDHLLATSHDLLFRNGAPDPPAAADDQ